MFSLKCVVWFWFSCSSAMASSPPHNFSWVEQGKLAGLALPRMTAEYQYLLDNGIKHLVCLCERKPPNYDTCPGLKLHHIKIVDFAPPSPSQIDRFLGIVEEANSRGEVSFPSRAVTSFILFSLSFLAFLEGDIGVRMCFSPLQGVAVHCMHGHGRTGTMLACYLVKTQKICGADAIEKIRQMRKGSIETVDQEKAVVQFHQRTK